MDKPKDDLPLKKAATEEHAVVRKVNVWLIVFFGVYFVVLSVLILYAVIKVWSVGDTIESQFVLFRLQVKGEVRLIMIAALSGCLGSLIHAMTSFTVHIGKREFENSWICWYILSPFIGMTLALIFYFVIQGGFLALAGDAEITSPFGVAGLSGLVGMFSRNAINKLAEIFKNIFKTEDDEDDKDHPEQL